MLVLVVMATDKEGALGGAARKNVTIFKTKAKNLTRKNIVVVSQFCTSSRFLDCLEKFNTFWFTYAEVCQKSCIL